AGRGTFSNPMKQALLLKSKVPDAPTWRLMHRLSPVFVERVTECITRTLRTIHGATTSTVTPRTTAEYTRARRQPKPATSHATNSAPTSGAATGRINTHTPSRTPSASNRRRSNWRCAHGALTTTYTNSKKTALKTVSV